MAGVKGCCDNDDCCGGFTSDPSRDIVHVFDDGTSLYEAGDPSLRGERLKKGKLDAEQFVTIVDEMAAGHLDPAIATELLERIIERKIEEEIKADPNRFCPCGERTRDICTGTWCHEQPK